VYASSRSEPLWRLDEETFGSTFWNWGQEASLQRKLVPNNLLFHSSITDAPNASPNKF
jgi:hypothetical protein